MKLTNTLLVAAGVCASSLALAYDIQEIDTGAYEGVATDISENGIVSGTYFEELDTDVPYCTSEYRQGAFKYAAGTIELIAISEEPTCNYSNATPVLSSSVNYLGDVVGNANGVNYLFNNGALTDLGPQIIADLGDDSYNQPVITGVNNNGAIIGSYNASAIATVDGTFQIIDKGSLGAEWDTSKFVNDHGDILVSNSGRYGYQTFSINRNGVKYSRRDLLGDNGCCGFEHFSANAFNNLGQFAGSITDSTEGPGFFDGSDVIDTGLFDGQSVTVLGMNDHGVLVGGVLSENSGYGTAVIYQDGAWTDLNSLLNDGTGWQVVSAYDINNAGVITGSAVKNGQSRAVVLTPNSPAPALVWLRGGFNDWGVFPMRYVDGLYHANVTFNAGDVPFFKFDASGDWTVAYGDDNADGVADLNGGDISVSDVPGNYDITYNADTQAYSIQRTPQLVGQLPNVYLRGHFNYWQSTRMTLVSDFVWQVEVDVRSRDDDPYNEEMNVEGLKFDVYGDWAVAYGASATPGTAALDGDNILFPEYDHRYRVTFNDQTLAYSFEDLGVLNKAPTANAGDDFTVAVGETFTLDGSASFDEDGEIVQWQWDYDEIGETISRQIDEAGTYRFNLIVTDDDGATGYDTVTVTVVDVTANYETMSLTGDVNSWTPGATPMALVGMNTWEVELDLEAGSRFKFTPYSNWTLSFGDRDGNGVADSDGGGNITVQDGAGTYRIQFNDETLAYSIELTSVTNLAPVAQLGSDVTVTVGDTVTFDAGSSYDPDGSIVDYAWTNASGTGATAQATFNDAGTFVVTVTVTDDAGDTDSDSVTVTVEEEGVSSNYPTMHVAGDHNSWAFANSPMTLVDDYTWQIVLDLDAGSRFKFVPVNWSTSFGDNNADGIADSNGGGNIVLGGGAGEYRLTFNDETLAYSIELTTPGNQAPNADISSTALEVTVGGSIRFTGDQSSDSDGTIVDYAFSTSGASDIAVVSSDTVDITFNATGTQTVTLVVTDDAGDTDSASVQVTVLGDGFQSTYPTMHLVGHFNGWSTSATPMTLVDNYTWQVDVELESTHSMKFVPEDWSLSFGDNNGDGVADSNGGGNIPAGAAGNYRVTFNDSTLEYSLELLTSGNQAPTAVINASSLEINQGESITFDGGDSSDSDGSIVAWLWNGSTSGETATLTFDEPGTHQVSLQVTDNEGATAMAIVNVTVNYTGSSVNVAFTCNNGTTSQGQNVYVVGNHSAIGSWSPANAVQLSPTAYPSWTGTLTTIPANTQLQWKCIKKDQAGNVVWESGSNNTLSVGGPGDYSTSGSF